MGTVLVVDDEPILLELLVEILRDEGHALLTARDGMAAVEVLERVVPDLVVTDTMMPLLDGRGLVRWMRGQPRLRHVPVVILSAVARIDPAELGAIVFLAKPFDVELLLDAVGAALHPEPA